jgi:hypothetical protein
LRSTSAPAVAALARAITLIESRRGDHRAAAREGHRPRSQGVAPFCKPLNIAFARWCSEIF